MNLLYNEPSVFRKLGLLCVGLAAIISCSSKEILPDDGIRQNGSLQSSLVARAIEFNSGEPTDDQVISGDDAWCSTENAKILAYNLKTINSSPGVRFGILGFTDKNECLDYDCRSLSLLRAQLVYSWLIDNGVAERVLLKPVGFGAKMAIDDNETDGGRQRNRRVEINIVP